MVRPRFPTELVTERLRLRMWEPSSGDPQDYARIAGDAQVMRYLQDGQPLAPAVAADNVREMRAHWAQHGFGWWAVEDRATGCLAGTAGMCHANADDLLFPLRVEIGLVLARPWWGRGLGAELAAVCRDAAFAAGAAKVFALADRDNRGSIAVMRRVGMELERTLENRGRASVLYACGEVRGRG